MNIHKCSIKKHGDINATNYCSECNIFMCNKCVNLHSELFENHHKFNIDQNIKDIFTGICKESNHKQELEFYCKNHNKLCCAACLSKIKGNSNGQHYNCDVCLIHEIKEEKKNKLIENIKFLEDFSDKLENSIKELKIIFEKLNNEKDSLKMKISKIFTKIRNVINEREDELLLEVDNKYNNFTKDYEINKIENIPDKIKIFLEKGKILNKEWEKKENNINSIINDCINIENNIIIINQINETIEKYNLYNDKISFIPDNDDEINEYLEKLKIFGKIVKVELENFKFKFKSGTNYTLSNNNLVATKTSGGDSWNCTIIGDKEIPKDKISKWKIKINNFKIKFNNWGILIGIGPNNPNNEEYFNRRCISFICGKSKLCIKSRYDENYNNKSGKLKEGDIIEVIVDRKLGNLSFSVNGDNYGIAYSNIEKEETLYPIVMINDENQIVEIIN